MDQAKYGKIVVSTHNSESVQALLRVQMAKDFGWSSECSEILAMRPLDNFRYDRLAYSSSKIFDKTILLNPLMCICPSCGDTISLKRMNYLDKLHDHIMRKHGADERLINDCLSIERDIFKDRDSTLPLYKVNNNNRDELNRLVFESKPEEVHYLVHWFDEFIKAGLVTPKHLIYQELDAFMEVALRYPMPSPTGSAGWKFWPTLSSFTESLASAFSRFTQKLYLGSHLIADATDYTLQGLKAFINNINHVGPSVSTVSRWKPPLVLESGPHILDVVLHLRMLIKNKAEAVHISNEDVDRFFVVLIYDEQNVNQGIFPVKRGTELMLGGFSKLMPLDNVDSNTLPHKISNDPSYSLVSAVREYRVADFADLFCSNPFTTYVAKAANR
jgi:hypothetical protein